MLRHNVNVSPENIAQFCRRYHVSRLMLFGSVLRDDFRPDSDVDVLVEFEAGPNAGAAFLLDAGRIERLVGQKSRSEHAALSEPPFPRRCIARSGGVVCRIVTIR